MSTQMNNRPSLNNKALILDCRHGMTANEIAAKYQFTSVDALYDFIEKNFGNSREIKSYLKKNEKNKGKSFKSDSKKSMVIPKSVEKAIEKVIINETSENTSQEGSCVEVKITDQKSSLSRLEQLSAIETELSKLCFSLENDHKIFSQKRSQVDDELKEVREDLNQILRRIDEDKNRISTLQNQHNELSEKMQAKYQELSEARSKLSEIREEIDSLKVVSILVYSDKLEIENFEEKGISEEAIDSWFKKLLSAPEAEELKLKEVRNIAKLLSVVEVLRVKKIKFELIFDSMQAQTLYEEFCV